MLQSVLGSVALHIEHVGSTAVVGLAAKPVLDIAIAVRRLNDTRQWPAQLKPEGYTYFGDREKRNDDFYAKGPDDCRTIYLHVVEASGDRWKDYLFFRDTLKQSAIFRKEYEVLKLRLCALHPDDRAAYTAAKSDWIAQILKNRPNHAPEPMSGLAPGHGSS